MTNAAATAKILIRTMSGAEHLFSSAADWDWLVDEIKTQNPDAVITLDDGTLLRVAAIESIRAAEDNRIRT